MPDPKYPFGPATVETIGTHAATRTVTVFNQKHFLNLGTMTSDVALTVATDGELEAGAELVVIAKSDASARNVNLTGALPAQMPGTISKTKVQTFVYTGSAWIAKGAIVQID